MLQKLTKGAQLLAINFLGKLAQKIAKGAQLSAVKWMSWRGSALKTIPF